MTVPRDHELGVDSLPRLVRWTPRGRGAVAVLRLEGPGAVDAVESFFRKRSSDESAAEGLREIGRVRYGRWVRGDDPGAAAEDVVLCQVEPGVVEIHCHGGEQAPSAITKSLVESERALLVDLESEIDRRFPQPWRREAFRQLRQATAPIVAKILWDQYRGAWPRFLEGLIDSSTEAESSSSLDEVRERVVRALRFTELGRHLVDPWRIVLAGPPNVGKSSLVNRLVGYERAIAYDQPGTTRDVLTVRGVLAGLPVEFSDTAGIRESDDALEAEGIDRARRALSSADLALLLAEASAAWTAEADSLLADHPTAIVVHHKSDLTDGIPSDRPPGIAVSSLTGVGVDDLLTEIEGRIAPEIPAPGEFVPICDDQLGILRRLIAAIDEGVEAIRSELRAAAEIAGPSAIDGNAVP